MKLNDKIYYLRKKCALSQEQLADILGVSRQSVSKWECGTALPEIDKLTSLASTFGVSVDWLLSDEDPADKTNTECDADSMETENIARPTQSAYPEWMDRAPGFIVGLLKRFGWLFGVYVTVIGGLFMGLGGIAKFITGLMVDSFNSTTSSMMQGMGGFNFGSGSPFYDSFVEESTKMLENNPVDIIANIFLIIGAIICVLGIVLTVILRKHSKR